MKIRIFDPAISSKLLKRSFFTVLLFMAFLSLPVFTEAQENVSGSPDAFVPQPSFEFEPVPEGAVIAHDFIILNRGITPLLIHKVNTG
jgi:hypothetical protein